MLPKAKRLLFFDWANYPGNNMICCPAPSRASMARFMTRPPKT
jgi:hypothetical protein